MNNDNEKFDEILRTAAQDYNRPPNTFRAMRCGRRSRLREPSAPYVRFISFRRHRSRGSRVTPGWGCGCCRFVHRNRGWNRTLVELGQRAVCHQGKRRVWRAKRRSHQTDAASRW